MKVWNPTSIPAGLRKLRRLVDTGAAYQLDFEIETGAAGCADGARLKFRTIEGSHCRARSGGGFLVGRRLHRAATTWWWLKPQMILRFLGRIRLESLGLAVDPVQQEADAAGTWR